MQVLRSARFDEESRRYDLRYTCEDCGHFDPPSETCRHGWPSEAHRKAGAGSPAPGDAVVFCKEFEVL
jgi:hypothetical protein